MQTSPSDSQPTIIKVAIVGAGPMANEHARAFASIPAVSIVGFCSRTRISAETLAARFPGCIACGTVAELHAKTAADILLIVVPPLAAREVCLSAFNYPWLCLIEKPAGYNIPEAELIAKLARDSSRAAYIALNRRHYSSTRTVLAEAMQIDEPRLIQVSDQEDPASRPDCPLLIRQTWMYGNSIHIIDYLRMFGRGEIVRVEPIIRWNPDQPRFVVAKVEFSSGDVGIYTAIWNGPGPWAVTITTQKKRWEFRPLEQAGVQLYGSRKTEALSVHRWDNDFKPGLRLQAEETIRALKGLPNSLPTVAEGLETMRLVKAIYEN